jgi:Protein of unknown function (DUF2786)
MQMIWQDCERCGTPFAQPYDPGRRRQFCSNACRQSAYRARVRYAKQAREQREREEQARRWQEEARRSEEEARRRERARQRSHRQPPPHAGTSRPGSWCGACGGTRAAHTFHHDDAAHERAHRRYKALRRKAASTSFPEEAAACRSKAEQLRTKYGL